MQKVLRLRESDLQTLARNLVVIAARLPLEEALLPGFVAGLPLPNMEFQRRR